MLEARKVLSHAGGDALLLEGKVNISSYRVEDYKAEKKDGREKQKICKLSV
jgi:hypothetical protein